MELAAEIAEASLEVRQIDLQPAWQAEEAEVVAVPPDRQDPAALRTEVIVDWRAGAAASAFELRYRANRDGLSGGHGGYAPKELPQPQVCFAFGLLNTNPLPRSAAS
jgi:hypothetical protein